MAVAKQSKKLTTVALVEDEGARFAVALADNVPAPAPVMLVVQRGASADEVLSALMRMRGIAMSYGFPVDDASFARQWPASSNLVEHHELPMQLGAPPRKPAEAPKPAQWTKPLTEREAYKLRMEATLRARDQREAEERAEAERQAAAKAEAERKAAEERAEAKRAAGEGGAPPSGDEAPGVVRARAEDVMRALDQAAQSAGEGEGGQGPDVGASEAQGGAQLEGGAVPVVPLEEGAASSAGRRTRARHRDQDSGEPPAAA